MPAVRSTLPRLFQSLEILACLLVRAASNLPQNVPRLCISLGFSSELLGYSRSPITQQASVTKVLPARLGGFLVAGASLRQPSTSTRCLSPGQQKDHSPFVDLFLRPHLPRFHFLDRPCLCAIPPSPTDSEFPCTISSCNFGTGCRIATMSSSSRRWKKALLPTLGSRRKGRPPTSRLPTSRTGA